MKREKLKLIRLGKIITSSFVLVALVVFLFGALSAPVKAETPASPVSGLGLEQPIQENLTAVGEQTLLSKEDPRVIVGRIIKIVLGLLGLIVIVLIIYAGFLYMTSGGEGEKIDKAKLILKNAVIGLAIIFCAYAITTYVFNVLLARPGEGGLGTAGQMPGTGYALSGGAFGSVIQSHYPQPEQTGVPRNVMILVTFRLPISPESVITSDRAGCPEKATTCGQIRDTFKVFRCDEMPEWSGAAANDCLNATIKDPDNNKLVPGYALITEDHRTVVFNPYGDNKDQHLGSSQTEVAYVVHLLSGIRQENNADQSIFNAQTPDYKWRFTTSTIVDLIPPRITSVVPKDQAGIDPAVRDVNLDSRGKVYLNQILVVNFNEPVLPLLRQTQTCGRGENDNYSDSYNEAQILLKVGSEKVAGCNTLHVPGQWRVGMNGYQTMEFISESKCQGVERNSCGEPVYCLPNQSEFNNLLLAAQVDSGVSLIGTGLVDAAGNSLDGNKNGQMDGPGDPPAKDNYFWRFATGNSLDLTPPSLISAEPSNGTGSLAPDVLIKATFDEGLSPDSVEKSVDLYGSDFTSWYDAQMGRTVIDNEEQIDLTQIVMEHGLFTAWEEGSQATAPTYTPAIRATVKDLRQNCYSPSRDAGLSQCQSIASPGYSCCPAGNDFQLIPKDAAQCNVPGEPVQ